MSRPDPQKIALAHKHGEPLKTVPMKRTAGEVRFIKDRSGDTREWGWNTPGPSAREIEGDFVFQPKNLKPLVQCLRSGLMALGHASSAQQRFLKLKSRRVSPDGNLGGKGYIQKISEMRRQLMNCAEALSAFTDTVYDEIHASHWNPSEDTLDPRDRQEVREIVEDVEEIKEDPEGWAEEQEAEMDEGDEGKTAKLAFLSRTASDNSGANFHQLRNELYRIERLVQRCEDRYVRTAGRGVPVDLNSVLGDLATIRKYLSGESV